MTVTISFELNPRVVKKNMACADELRKWRKLRNLWCKARKRFKLLIISNYTHECSFIPPIASFLRDVPYLPIFTQMRKRCRPKMVI